MINTFTVPESGNYRCTDKPLDGRSAVALLAIGQDGTSVTIAEWAGTNPFCEPRGGTVDVFKGADRNTPETCRRAVNPLVSGR